MDEDEVAGRISEAVRALRARRPVRLPAWQPGGGHSRQDSGIDLAAFFGPDAPAPFEVLLPAGVDLLVLNDAPLELAGQVAVHGKLVFEDDPAERVRWQATTRKIYFDELPRVRRSHREFAESLRRGR